MGKKKDENMAGLQAEALEKAHCSHSKTSIEGLYQAIVPINIKMLLLGVLESVKLNICS